MTSLCEEVVPPYGSVKLQYKLTPICERNEPFDDFYAFTRAVVDISKFKEKLRSLPKEIWYVRHHNLDFCFNKNV